MDTADHSEPIDWRKRLHSLPSGIEPMSPAGVWFFRAFLCIALFLAGSVLVLLSGVFFGFSRGIGPDETGGAVYILCGLVFDVIAGAALAAFVARRSNSRTMPRLVFYAFAGPAFLGVILMALASLEHLFL